MTLDSPQITDSENLTLGLMGGFKLGGTRRPHRVYDPALVGAGAMSLNAGRPGRGKSYLEAGKFLAWRVENGLKTGRFKDSAGIADDSEIPEIVDNFPSPRATRQLPAHLRGRGSRVRYR